MTTVRIDDSYTAHVVSTTLERGGATISATTGNTATTGWAVALEGCEHRMALDSFTAYAVRVYISRHRAELATTGNYLGTWVDGSDVVLDISEVVQDTARAIALGRARKQDAIFNLGTGETWWLK